MDTNEHMSLVHYELKGSVVWITLNRPEVYNSFNREMILALQACLDKAAADQEVRAVVLTGSGKAFCAGQDLAEVLEAEKRGEKPDFTRVVEEHYTPVITKICALNKPVIAAVNGVAAGAGANVALACDLVVATQSANFIQAFSKIGLVPDSGGTYFLPRLVGRQRANALMMLGDKISSEEAKAMGMIYDWYPDDTFIQGVSALAERLAAMPTLALAYTKQLLNQSMQNTLDEQLKLEGVYQQRAGETQDYAEGVASFLQKRKPIFKGQ